MASSNASGSSSEMIRALDCWAIRGQSVPLNFGSKYCFVTLAAVLSKTSARWSRVKSLESEFLRPIAYHLEAGPQVGLRLISIVFYEIKLRLAKGLVYGQSALQVLVERFHERRSGTVVNIPEAGNDAPGTSSQE